MSANDNSEAHLEWLSDEFRLEFERLPVEEREHFERAVRERRSIPPIKDSDHG